MNIKVSDSVIQDILQKHITGVGIENAIKSAIQDMTKVKVIELIKSNPEYLTKLNTAIEESIVEAFNVIAKRIARDLGGYLQ